MKVLEGGVEFLDVLAVLGRRLPVLVEPLPGLGRGGVGLLKFLGDLKVAEYGWGCLAATKTCPLYTSDAADDRH